MIHKNTNPNGKLFSFINGIFTIIDGLVKVLSFNYLRGDFSYKHIKSKLK
jgi:hypothetical protein